jgi:hypothetical protein
MVERRLPFASHGVNISRELTLKSGVDVVERKGVGGEVNPSRVGSEKAKGFSRPETVWLTPGSNIGDVLTRVSVESFHVVLPLHLFNIKVLLEDSSPFGARDASFDGSESSRGFHALKLHVGSEVNVVLQFVPGFVILVADGTTFKVNNTSESVEVSVGSSSGELGSETVTSNGSHSNFVSIHVSHDIVGHLIDIVRSVVVRVSLVSHVNEMDVSVVQDLVIGASEEFSEVLSRLHNIGEPEHGGHVFSTRVKDSWLQSNVSSASTHSDTVKHKSQGLLSQHLSALDKLRSKHFLINY